jgi:hypothetical protein
MKEKREFFDACKETWRDGYLIPVRNRMGNMIEREFLPIELKNSFQQKFGTTIIYDDEFLEWYCSHKS